MVMMVPASRNDDGGSNSTENWADFEATSSSPCCHIHYEQQQQQQQSSSTFVVFETSSWYSWILGTGRTPSPLTPLAPSASIVIDDDDGWMSRLLPLQQQQQQLQNQKSFPLSSTRKTPLLRKNPRDMNSHFSSYRTTTHYQFYQAAYIANTNNSNNNDDSLEPNVGEHLSNEEWIFQRRRRERRIRRRYQQEVEHMLGIQQVFRSNLDDMNEWNMARRRVDQHLFMQRLVADGQILLDTGTTDDSSTSSEESRTEQMPNSPDVDEDLNNDISVTNEQHVEEQSTAVTDQSGAFPRHQHLQPQQPPTPPPPRTQHQRPQHRLRARRLPVTSQARRDRFHHWSASAIQLSLDLVLIPWRMVFQSDDDRAIDVSVSTSANDSFGEAVPSESERSASEEDLWSSTRGWRQDQNVAEYDGDSYDDDDDDDGISLRSDGTQYWSTGTAMETDYDSSSYEEGRGATHAAELISEDADTDHGEDWESDLAAQFPITEEEDPHQYEFLPTPEDPLFPDDPFEGRY
jgi:hypothetical protein